MKQINYMITAIFSKPQNYLKGQLEAICIRMLPKSSESGKSSQICGKSNGMTGTTIILPLYPKTTFHRTWNSQLSECSLEEHNVQKGS